MLINQGRKMIQQPTRRRRADADRRLGSTPSNIANKLAGDERTAVIAVNLPMLVRIFNYPKLAAGDGHNAVEGGTRHRRQPRPRRARRTPSVERTVTIVNLLGLHARRSAW